MIDDLNLDFEDHDRGRGRRRRAERADERAADRGQGGWDSRQQYGRDAQPDPREQTWGGRGHAPDRYDTGGQPRFDTGGQQRYADPRYDERQDTGQYGTGQYGTGQYDSGQYGSGQYGTGRPDPGGQPRYDTGGQPRYDTGGQPRFDTGGQQRYADPRYDTGGGPRYDTGGQQRYDTGGQQRYADPRAERQFDPRYDTGSRRYEQLADDRHDPRYDTQGGGGGGGFFDDGFGGGSDSGGGDDGGRRRVKKSKKKRKGRSYLALFLTLVLLGGLGGAAYFGYNKISNYFLTPDYDGTGTSETVQIEVKQGQLLAEIGNTLVKADVVKSAKAFTSAAEENKDSTKIQPGFYTMHKQMSGTAAVAAMLDPKNRLTNGVTIPEGLIAIQIYSLLSEKLKIPVEDFKKAADPVKLGIPDWWYKRGDNKKVAGGVEGFLFPDTYAFPPNVTAESALKTMVDRFLTVTGNLNFAETVQSKLHISPYEALVAASIGQAEVVKAEDYPKVARVLYNRVYTDNFPCKCLQIDSAVNYWLRVTGKVPKDSSQILRGEQHNPKDPYNTFDAPAGSGLPIGPISNPGEAALKGAMSPAAGPWVYFMTIDKAGTMGYAVDWNGHCANYAKAVKAGILSGTCNG